MASSEFALLLTQYRQALSQLVQTKLEEHRVLILILPLCAPGIQYPDAENCTSAANALTGEYRRRAYYQILHGALRLDTFKVKTIFQVLTLRESIHQYLTASPQQPVRLLQQLLQLDQQLKAVADRIDRILTTNQTSLKNWRSLHPHLSNQWWWHLEDEANPHLWDRYDKVWQSLTVLNWVVNLSLAAEIGTRFLTVGAGVPGAFTIIGSATLAFLQTRSETTNALTNWLQKTFRRRKVPHQLQAEAQLGMSFSTFLLLLAFWNWGMPLTSTYYNVAGNINHNGGNLSTAEKDYKRSISINPQNFFAYYNLGSLYDDLQQFDAAEEAYLIAAKSPSLPDAHNNLGRLYILRGEQDQSQYKTAAIILHEGLRKALNPKNKAALTVKYSIYKNLGWLELAQNRPNIAQDYLQNALKVADQIEARDQGIKFNRSAANCLMAQAFSRLDQSEDIDYYWRECCVHISLTQPEEYQWLIQARKELGRKITQCKDLTSVDQVQF
ncbi:MAG: tetratricopeptide repeat protein [Spirulinaceae cyanobacterium]